MGRRVNISLHLQVNKQIAKNKTSDLEFLSLKDTAFSPILRGNSMRKV